MQIREVMTKNIVSVTTGTDLKECAVKMKENDTGVLPVYESDELKGLLTDRDIVIRSIAEGKDPAGEKAGSIMTGSVEKCSEEDDIEQIARKMKENKIRRLPVFNSEGKLSGMVSLGDLSVKGDEKLAEETLEKVSEEGE
jgi:CBS domain-containing protein